MCGAVCWLLLMVVVLQADAGGNSCNTPDDGPTTRVLLDSYNFPVLFPPWSSVGTPGTVSSS